MSGLPVYRKVAKDRRSRQWTDTPGKPAPAPASVSHGTGFSLCFRGLAGSQRGRGVLTRQVRLLASSGRLSERFYS